MNLVGFVESAQGIGCEAWLEVIRSHPALETMEPAEGINPFTKKSMLYDRPYAAWVVVDGSRIGSMIWEADCIHVSGADVRVSALAAELALRLGAVFSRAHV